MNAEVVRVYTVKQAAEILQVSCHQIRKMIQHGELSAVKVGREWRIPSHALQGFLKTPST